MHPDPDVDICVMPVEPLRRQSADAGRDPFATPLRDALIPTDEALTGLSAMEEVVMVGYPIGLWDAANNFPILRRGHTASHPATNFQGKPQGLVDMACFPGSSGSPILIINEGGYATPNGFSVGTRIHFLGVLFGDQSFVPMAAWPLSISRPVPLRYLGPTSRFTSDTTSRLPNSFA